MRNKLGERFQASAMREELKNIKVTVLVLLFARLLFLSRGREEDKGKEEGKGGSELTRVRKRKEDALMEVE